MADFAFAAKKRGIISMWVMAGAVSFLHKPYRPMQQGFKPNSISTDIHTGSMNGGMKDMLNIMSKFINMGMSWRKSCMQ